MGILSGLAGMLGWGIADFLAAVSSRRIGFVLTLLWMEVIGFAISLTYFLITVKSFEFGNVIPFLGVLLLVGLLNLIGYLAFYKGFRDGMVSVVSPLASSGVIIVVILSIIFYEEVLQINQAIGVILVILGTILVSTNIPQLLTAKRLHAFKGVKEGLIAMAGFGLSMFLIVPAARALGWFLPAFSMKIFAILFLTLFLLVTKQPFRTNLQPSIVALLVPIGILDMGALFAYNFGVSGFFASIVAPITSAFPLISIILAKIIFKEKIVLNQSFGIVLIIVGLILMSI